MTAPSPHHAPEVLAAGRRRLAEWLPAAREAARAEPGQITEMSALARAQRPHLTEANLDAVVIYPAPLGGWHADVLLKQAPPGVANVLGTPSDNPAATEAEAESIGRSILAFCLQGDVQADAAPPAAPPAFLLNGWSVMLLPELLALGAHLQPDRAAAIASLESLLGVLCPKGFDGNEYNRSWPREDQARLLAVLHRSALNGVLAYPLRHDASPTGHRGAAGQHQ